MVILDKRNLRCNFKCDYCYQTPIRPEDEIIDHEAVEATIRREYENKVRKFKSLKPRQGPSIALHGGECSMLPKDIFERSLKLSYELRGCSSIQTNGYLIDDEHIELFKKYNTHVSFSIDGPYPLNKFRGIGTPEQRRSQTEKILNTLYKIANTELPEEHWNVDQDGNKIPTKIGTSIIAVIHRANALGENREIFKKWIKEISEIGITGRMNICVTGDPKYDLTPEEAADFYEDMFDFLIENGLSGWGPFRDVMGALRDSKNRHYVCVYKTCDPYHTLAATTIRNNGEVGVCLKLHQDGKEYLRHERFSDIRDRVLRNFDCKDCEWWEYCKGGCSGHAIDFDWRNKDRFCIIHKTLFKKAYNLLKFTKIPIYTYDQKDGEFPDWYGTDHADGMEHIDGNTRHLDSE